MATGTCLQKDPDEKQACGDRPVDITQVACVRQRCNAGRLVRMCILHKQLSLHHQHCLLLALGQPEKAGVTKKLNSHRAVVTSGSGGGGARGDVHVTWGAPACQPCGLVLCGVL